MFTSRRIESQPDWSDADGIKIYTVSAQGRTVDRSAYAARFAAKEAFLKALKTGWRGKITWQDMEILNDADGVPSLAVKGEARRILDEMGVPRVHLSLSHTTEHAVAYVVLETE